MKVLLIGKNGQLAWEMQRGVPESVDLSILGSADFDIGDADGVSSKIEGISPEAVDKAESEEAEAYRVNQIGISNLAQACKKSDARLLHVSTDFVFDGSNNTPYQPKDRPNPSSVYGASKLAGEEVLKEIVPDSSVIVRTSWVYSANGSNFVKTMLRLMASKPELGVVVDQIGTPTWAKGLANLLWVLADKPEVTGVYHWSDAGTASWYDFAVAIQELAVEKGLLDHEIPIKPIPSSAYPTPATRPLYSVLDKSLAEQASGLKTIHWRKQLSSMLDELPR